VCTRVRRWLEPVWGLRLPPADYVSNDLNLPNILTGGALITGVVDWDEFGLGSRARPSRPSSAGLSGPLSPLTRGL